MRYADILGEKDSEPAIARFFGVFGMILSTCTIWGSLINSAGKKSLRDFSKIDL